MSAVPLTQPASDQSPATAPRAAGRGAGDAAGPERFDAVVVGAGFAGLYLLHRLRSRGLSVRVLDTATDVGGTWYWNRYPGARCDVPSMEYSYSWSEELQQEWRWSEVMSPQPEILAYAQHVADRFDLRRDIRFATTVVAAHFDEADDTWLVTTDSGEQLRATFCIMATGALSATNTPDLPGLDRFTGDVLHTGRWPKEPVDLRRRVAVLGTGSSGVQAIPVIAEAAEHLYVLQRTPTFTFPANNKPLRPDVQEAYKEHYDEVRQRQRHSVNGFSGWSPVQAAPKKSSAGPRTSRPLLRELSAQE
ncbi:MAG: flavin-containing monooxygenase, partial [Acidimicrobiia bacterium]